MGNGDNVDNCNAVNTILMIGIILILITSVMNSVITPVKTKVMDFDL